MRIRRLKLQGFMPYRDEQELDFSQWDTFALVGPTGSGKSSLLDAITFAVFGHTPRWNNAAAANKLVSTGVRDMRVELELDIATKRYCIVRQVKLRKGSVQHDAEVRHWVDGQWKPLHGDRRTSRAATTDIESLIGMSYETFTRTLLLPQGQFDRLLKPDKPAQRKELLIELAGLSVYDRMSERTRRRLEELKQGKALLENELSHYAEATPKARAALEAELARTGAEKSDNERRIQELTAQLTDQETCLRLQTERDHTVQRERVLVGESPEIERLQARTRMAMRLQSESHRLEALASARDRCATAERGSDQARRALKEAQQATERAEAQQQEAERAAAAVPELEARLIELTELRPLSRRWTETGAQLEVTARDLEQCQGAQSRVEPLRERVESRRRRLEALEPEIGALDTEDREPTLQVAREQLRVMQQLTQELTGKREAQTKNDADRLQADRDRDSAAEGLQRAQRQLLDLERVVEELRQGAHFEHTSHRLRHELRAGQPCPVCRQEVTVVPDIESRDDPGNLEAAEEDAGKGRQVLTRAQVELGQRRDRVRALDDRAKELANELEQAQTRLSSTVEPLQKAMSWKTLPTHPEREISQRLKDERARKEELRNLQRERETIQKELPGLQEELHREVSAQQALESKRQHLSEEQERLTAEQGRMADELANRLGTSFDFEPVLRDARAEVTTRLERVQKDRATSREHLLVSQGQLATARSLCDERERSLTELSDELNRRNQDFTALLEQLGLASEQSFRDSLMPEAERAASESRCEEHTRQLTSCREILKALEQALAGREVDQDVVQQTRASVAELRSQLELQIKSVGELEERIRQTSSLIEKAAEVNQRLQTHLTCLNSFATLDGLLNARGLKAYVANRLFQQIVELASRELERLSGRYRLLLDGDDLLVEDSWNANETRDVRSLSGGETFLASLSLALAMVDYLSQGTPLESLFIDEGFGTLDAESLEAVILTLESLQARGRLVGIITHVPELAERMPVQVRVIKEQERSRLEVS